MSQPSPTSQSGLADRNKPQAGRRREIPPPARPAFGFLLVGTTLGIAIGCVLLCAGARPPEVIIILLSIFGAVIGGILEALWPHKVRRERHVPVKSPLKASLSNCECQRCGEVFPPDPITCPMCGHTEKRK